MLNRRIELKLVKPTTQTTPAVEEDTFADRLIDFEFMTNRIFRNVGKGVCAYVVLDTLRKIAVTRFSK